MANLTLLGIQCYNTVPGQPLSILPFFLDGYIGSSTVTLSDESLVPFPPDAMIDITLKSGYIYLVINNQTLLVSENYIWDTDQAVNTYTGFRDFYGGPSPYSIYVSYTLSNNFFALFLNTIQGIALKVFLFVRSVFRIMLNPPRKVPLDSIFKDGIAKSKSSKESAIK